MNGMITTNENYDLDEVIAEAESILREMWCRKSLAVKNTFLQVNG